MPKILLVDDEVNILNVLEKFFKLKGFEVVCANNGRDALGHINSGDNIGMVIVDLRMSGVSGVDILKTIAAMNKKIPAVILSGCPQVDEKDLEELKKLGLSETDVFCKPMDLFVLLEVVNNKLSLKS